MGLFLLSLILTFINYIWIRNNLSHLPPPWDQAAYINMSLNDYHALEQGHLRQLMKTILRQAPTHAPLFPATTVPFFFIFGVEISTAYIANFTYIFILLLSIFLITEGMAGKKAATLSVFLISTFPAVVAFSRDYLFEFPLAALTALSYLFLLKSDSFRNGRYAILFGICAGLSILTKTMGMIFFVLPFSYTLFVFARDFKSKTARNNILFSFFAAFIVASVYYIPNAKDIFGYLFYFGYGEGTRFTLDRMYSPLTIQNWTIYLVGIAQRGISLGNVFIFVISALAYFLRKERNLSKNYLIMWLWFVFGYLLLSSSPNKDAVRYSLPILSPIAIIMAVHISNISLTSLRYFIVALAVTVGIVNYSYQTLSENCRYESVSLKGIRILEPVPWTCSMQASAGLPPDKKWDSMMLLQYLDDLNKDKLGTTNVLIGFDHAFLNYDTMTLNANLGKLKGNLKSQFTFKTISHVSFNENELNEIIKEPAFIFTKTGIQGPDLTNKNNVALKLLLNNMQPLKSFTMSDGSEVSIYRGKNNCNLVSRTDVGDGYAMISCQRDFIHLIPGPTKPSTVFLRFDKAYHELRMVFAFDNPEKIPLTCGEKAGEINLTIKADGTMIYQKNINYKQQINYRLDLKNVGVLTFTAVKGKYGPNCDWFMLKNIEID